MKKQKIVPDTSVIISGILSDLIEKGEIRKSEIIIPEFVVEELRAQASRGREIGFKGLGELKKIRELAKKKKINITKTGRRQTYEEIQLARYGRIDALILDVAKHESAILYTSDMVQSLVAEAEGVATRYFKPYEKKRKLKLERFLTNDTMSLHLKEGCIPMAKRGRPGAFKLVRIGKKKLSANELEDMIREIEDAAKYEEDAFIEVGGHQATVIQLGNMRISIARPPFSDGVEITLVRPITKLTIDDYRLSKKLKERLSRKIEGVIVAGPPGSGKSCFATSLAEFYESRGKIVKTLESPRDLQVRPEITQYTKLKGSFVNTTDLLLLVRPDYCVFDEIRKTEEFEVFTDMRLAGIGMIGVVHATNPIDAIQRFITRVELGMIPHIIDTIIYIKSGMVDKVYNLSLIVKVPTGMREQDLARPVVEVRDFETNKLEYEIYTYGEENVIIPVRCEKEKGITRLAKNAILSQIRRYDERARVDIAGEKAIVYIRNEAIPRLIGRQGRTIKQLEDKLGISIEVNPLIKTLGKEIKFDKQETGAYFIFSFDKQFSGRNANFYSDKRYLFSAIIGKNGKVRIAKKSELGKEILRGLVKGAIKVFV